MEFGPARYSPLHRFLHWTTALFILGMIPVGLTMTRLADGPLKNNLYELHKSFGILVIALTFVRIAVRVVRGAPPPEPSLTPLQRRVSASVHHLIYVFLATAMLTGFIGTSMCCAPVNLFWAIHIPPDLPGGFDTAKSVLTVHRYAVYGLAILLVMHIGAALAHAFVFRDGVMGRMWKGAN